MTVGKATEVWNPHVMKSCHLHCRRHWRLPEPSSSFLKIRLNLTSYLLSVALGWAVPLPVSMYAFTTSVMSRVTCDVMHVHGSKHHWPCFSQSLKNSIRAPILHLAPISWYSTSEDDHNSQHYPSANTCSVDYIRESLVAVVVPHDWWKRSRHRDNWRNTNKHAWNALLCCRMS